MTDGIEFFELRGRTAMDNPRRRHDSQEEQQMLGGRGVALAYVPADKIPGADHWDRPVDTHGVVDGLSYLPPGSVTDHGFYKT